MALKRDWHTFCFRRGSLALETALVLPVVLLIIAFFMALNVHEQRRLLVAQALDATCAEFSLIKPLQDQLVPESSTASFSLPTWLVDEGEALVSEALISARVIDWIDQLHDQSLFQRSSLIPQDLTIEIQDDFQTSALWFIARYPEQILGYTYTAHVVALCPVWRLPALATTILSDSEKDGVWLLDNFARGQTFRQIFHANLPYDFPVIASWANQRATLIHSLDLTAPTYQKTSEISSVLRVKISQLAAFQGANYQREAEQIRIKASEIESRQIILIVPENYDATRLASVIDEMIAFSNEQGIQFVVRPYGVSHRYDPIPIRSTS
ncbi:MAG: hypothetical protein PHC86_02650 [Eubacteriales bacterium]|nr:hypothetical protein [Eubacteriales bacterium]